MKTVEVVAAVIMDGDRALCVQRGESKLDYISKKWEFPGGKIESGEEYEAALKREITEELKVSIAVGEKVMTVDHTYPDFRLIMHAFACHLSHQKASDVQLTEHLDQEWIAFDDSRFAELDWAAADVPIVKELMKAVGV